MAFSKARRLGDLITANAEQFITSAHITDTAITGSDIHSTFDLTGKTVTVATASAGDNDTSVASTAFVQQEIASLVDSAPGTLNTLNELAAALGDDANFSTTVTNSIATKLPLAGGTLTGGVVIGGDSSINRGNQTSGELLIGGTTDGGFIDFDGTSLQINTQRDPNTGAFINTSKSNARIELVGADGDAHIKFRTTASNNTSATERMRIDKNGTVFIGGTAHYSGGSNADDATLAVNGSIIRTGVQVTDFDEAYVTSSRGILEGTSTYQASNSPLVDYSGAGNFFHVTAKTTATSGSASNNYILQVAYGLTGLQYTRYSSNNGSTWSDWLQRTGT